MKIKSFKLKLIFSYIFVILLSFGVIAFFLDKNLEEDSLRNIETSLITQANLIGNQITPERLRPEDTLYLESLVKALSLKAKCRITVINNQGKVLADSEKSEEEIPQMENHRSRPEVIAALSGNTGINTRYSATLKINMLYVALPIRQENQTTAVLRLALPLNSVQKTLSAIRKTVFWGLIFSLCLAFILGSVFAARTVRPIKRMIQISREFSKGDFSRRIFRSSNDEIGELVATLNKMAQDIESKIKEIKTQNQKLAAIFNSMIEGIIVVDNAAHIVSVNPAVERIFAVVKKEIEGKIFLEAVRNNDISEIINAVLKNGRPVSAEIDLVFPLRKIFQISAAAIFDKEAVSGCLVAIHDITEIRNLETMRRDFVANVSHELKTPLTSIKGFVETLLEGALEDKENNRHFLNIIQEHANRLNSLINDLLELSHIESKEIKLELRDLDLHNLSEDAISGFKVQLKKKAIEFKNELPLNLTVKADKDKLAQVFINLFDNAIKFNKEKGWVRIYSQDKGDKIKIIIEDSGIGIPPRDLPRIFERFYRVDKARSRELGGTGLGLSIVKHIVELHGGEVGVESTEGLGSKLYFALPQ